MATLEEIARERSKLAEAEAEALVGLADHLRMAIAGLPAASMVAHHFATMAPRLEMHADRRIGMAHAAFDGLAQFTFEMNRPDDEAVA